MFSPPRSPHLHTYPASCSFFLIPSNQKTKTNTNKQTKKKSNETQNIHKQNKMKSEQKTLSPFCVGQLLLGMGLPLDYGCYTQ